VLPGLPYPAHVDTSRSPSFHQKSQITAAIRPTTRTWRSRRGCTVINSGKGVYIVTSAFLEVQISITPQTFPTTDVFNTKIPYTTVPLPAGLNRKLIIAWLGKLALAVPSLPTVTVATLMSCVLSVYHACTVG
jgi:hypothetical protein